MKCSVERLIEALIGIELAQARKAAEEKAMQARKASYVVTVSRSYGSLAKRLHRHWQIVSGYAVVTAQSSKGWQKPLTGC